jgi:hypothetical protein
VASVGALEEGALVGGEEGAGLREGTKEVLGADERMVEGEALDLGADEGAVSRDGSGALEPVVLEVAADAVFRLELEVGLLLLLQEGVLSPGGAVEDGSGVVGPTP